MNRRQALASAALLCCLGLAACGGDSDGGGGMTVTYSPATLSTWVFEDETAGAGVPAGATIAPVPTQPVYVHIADPGSTFAPGMVSITDRGGGRYDTTLRLQAGLAAGTHSGTLAVQLCRDYACAEPLAFTGSSLPYVVDVRAVATGLPPLTAGITVAGVPATSVNEGLSASGARTYRVSSKVGQAVEVTPSQPFVQVRWLANSANITPTITMLAAGARVTPGLLSWVNIGTGTLVGRSADGRKVEVTLDVSR